MRDGSVNAKANVDSPSFTGTPTAPTKSIYDDSNHWQPRNSLKALSFSNAVPKNRLYFSAQI